jgi:outer membrane protein assembly factor BamB
VGRRAARISLIVGLLVGVLVPGVVGAPAAGAGAISAPSPPPDSSVATQANALHDGKVIGATATPPLTKAWTRDLGGPVSVPLVADGRVFVTANNGPCCGQGAMLFALDARTGQDLWGPFNLGRAFTPSSGLTLGQGLLFALNYDGKLRAFDARTGGLWWTVDLPGMYSFTAPPTYANGTVYVIGAGVGGTVYAVGATDGGLRWTRGINTYSNGAPAVSSTGVYLSIPDATYAFDPASGATLWYQDDVYWPGPIGGATPVLSNGRVWLRDTGALYPRSAALDAATGAFADTFDAGYAPAFDGPTGYFLSDSTLTARNAGSQAALWSFAGDGMLGNAPLVVNGYVYATSSSGKIWALDPATGQPVWSDNVGGSILPSDERNVARPQSGLGAGQGMVLVPATNLLVAYAGAPLPPGDGLPYHPVVPARILDTRAAVGAPAAKVGPGATLPLQVTGQGGVPATGVSAVVLNVTVTEPTAGSFLTAWPAGQTRPLASNLNYSAGQTVPNLVTVKVGENGRVDLYNNSGSTHVVADIAGWFGKDPLLDGGARFNALPPARIFDTRAGSGKVGPGGTLDVQVTGRGEVPVSGVSAVVLNVTVTEPTAASFLTAWPAGEPRPLASNLNFSVGQTVPNLVMVKLGDGGKVSLFNNVGSTHVVVDVAGWYGVDPSPGSGFVALPPSRVLDTRAGAGTPLAPGATLALQVTGRGGVPAAGVSAVVLNVTVTEPSAGSFLTAWPGGEVRPVASNLNFVAGQTVPNLVVVKVGATGQVDLFNNRGTTHVVVDVAGWFG